MSFNAAAVGTRAIFRAFAAVRPPLPFALPKRVTSIVVFACTGIGSGLFCSAAIEDLKRSHPEARLSVIAHHKRMAVALHNPYADDVLPYSKSPIAWLKLLGRLKMRKPDVVVALRLNEDAVPLGYLANRRAFVGSTKRCKSLSFLLSRNIETPRDIHSVDEMLAIAHAAGGSSRNCGMVYEVTPQEAKAIDQRFTEWISNPFVVWQVGATTTGDPRVYPLELAKKAIGKLEKCIAQKIVLTGGAEEMEAARQIENAFPSVINICGKTTLEQTAAVIQRAALVVSRDTGVMHLATAIGTPVLALMHSARRVTLYGPPLQSGKNRVLIPDAQTHSDGKHPMQGLAWESVADCVVDMLA